MPGHISHTPAVKRKKRATKRKLSTKARRVLDPGSVVREGELRSIRRRKRK